MDLFIVNIYHTVRRALNPQLCACEGAWRLAAIVLDIVLEAVEGQPSNMRATGIVCLVGFFFWEYQVCGAETYT